MNPIKPNLNHWSNDMHWNSDQAVKKLPLFSKPVWYKRKFTWQMIIFLFAFGFHSVIHAVLWLVLLTFFLDFYYESKVLPRIYIETASNLLADHFDIQLTELKNAYLKVLDKDGNYIIHRFPAKTRYELDANSQMSEYLVAVSNDDGLPLQIRMAADHLLFMSDNVHQMLLAKVSLDHDAYSTVFNAYAQESKKAFARL